MQVLKDLTLDRLINLYEGIVVSDRRQVAMFESSKDPQMGELKRRCLKQDKMILGALKCAKINGYSGEE